MNQRDQAGVAPAPPPTASAPTIPASVAGATTGGTSGISTPSIPNPNVNPTTIADALRPETLGELKRRGGG